MSHNEYSQQKFYDESQKCWKQKLYEDICLRAVEEIPLICFKCEKQYMGIDGNCCCGTCCSYCNEDEEKEYYKVCCAENPDVEYFDTLHEAKAFCDKHADLDYGLIMLCDFEKNEIGDWGDYDEEEVEVLCGGCGKNDMRNYYKIPLPEDRCSDCEEEEEVDISCIESELDNMLYQENMDFCFDKPTKGKYETIYIIKREEDDK